VLYLDFSGNLNSCIVIRTVLIKDEMVPKEAADYEQQAAVKKLLQLICLIGVKPSDIVAAHIYVHKAFGFEKKNSSYVLTLGSRHARARRGSR
jgi:hypothetical protein